MISQEASVSTKWPLTLFESSQITSMDSGFLKIEKFSSKKSIKLDSLEFFARIRNKDAIKDN